MARKSDEVKKMRLGQENEAEGLALLPIVNGMPLTHVTLHPRLGRQQYKGIPNREAFARWMEECRHPLVYNGDICGLENGEWRVVDSAKLKGVMIGRGLLSRPWITYAPDLTANPSDLERETIARMHAAVYRHAVENLCGDSQILSRLHAFWEYLDVDPKAKKAIKKATTLRRYDEAVAALLGRESSIVQSLSR